MSTEPIEPRLGLGLELPASRVPANGSPRSTNLQRVNQTRSVLDDSVELFDVPVLTEKVVNIASVPQRSPLRYPGGKTWLVPQIRKWLMGLDTRPRVLIEPFAGGGIASLTAVMEGLVDRAVLCERDPEIANFWFCVLESGEELATRIESFVLTTENVAEVLDSSAASRMDLAFQTLLKNRVNRGGILAKGASQMKKGENGNGLRSRWYPDTIAERIRAIGSISGQLQFFQGDGVSLVDLCQLDASAGYFVDPPYTAAGKRAGSRLYAYNEIDHVSLFERMSVVHGAVMMTYDANQEVIKMARNWSFNLAKVPMKSTHHAVQYELLITSHELKA